jgi:sodium/potassium/calcium exchanger 6
VSLPAQDSSPPSKPSKRQHVKRILRHAWHTVFPTFHDFLEKSFVGKIAAIFAAPAVFVLTLTLPVIVIPYDSAYAHQEKARLTTDPLVAFEEEAAGHVLDAEEEVEDEMHGGSFNKWLMAVQCTFGPLFAVGVLFRESLAVL